MFRISGATGQGRPLTHLPGPSVKIYDITDHSIIWLVQVWGPTEDRRSIVDRLITEVKLGFDAASIPDPPIGVRLFPSCAS